MRADIVPGATFPDYELTDHTRVRRTLSELQGINPMILILSRGHYCPKDHQHERHVGRAGVEHPQGRVPVGEEGQHRHGGGRELHPVDRLEG